MLQSSPINDVDGSVEQILDGILDANIIEERAHDLIVEFDQDVDVAVGTRFAACSRTEQGGTCHAARAEIRRGQAQAVEDFVAAHADSVARSLGA